MCFGSKKSSTPAPAPVAATPASPTAAPADNDLEMRKRLNASNVISTTQGEFGSELGASSPATQ